MFDLDGTLVDSMDCYHSVLVESFARLGVPGVGKPDLMTLMRHGKNMIEALIPADWPERDATKQECRTIFRQIWEERSLTAIALHPEVPPAMKALCDQG